jgi:hypothetical protein
MNLEDKKVFKRLGLGVIPIIIMVIIVVENVLNFSVKLYIIELITSLICSVVYFFIFREKDKQLTMLFTSVWALIIVGIFISFPFLF